MDSFHLAHISDLHVLELAGTPPWRMLNKRLTGLGNLIGPRRGAHPSWLADALVQRLDDAAIDHVAFTGDLTNLALPSEFAAGARLLARIGDGGRLSAVPGNHDVYTAGAARADRADHALAPWTSGTARRDDYPWCKAPTPWLRIYGLSSAIPAPPMIAWGEVGRAQLDRLAARIAQEPSDVTTRVVLVHHNVHRRGKATEWTSRMRDADAVVDALLALGVQVLLHGHTHPPHRGRVVRGASSLWVLGCGSSTWHRPGHGQLAHLNVLTLGPDGLRAIRTEVWDEASRRFVVEHADALAASAAVAVPL